MPYTIVITKKIVEVVKIVSNAKTKKEALEETRAIYDRGSYDSWFEEVREKEQVSFKAE